MTVGPSLYEVAALVGEPVRLRVLVSLMGGEARPASELARIANVSPPAASAHLAKLVNGHLLSVERVGRCRLYRLASGEVAHAIEAVAALSQPVGTDIELAATSWRLARTCYDHLAGRLSVELCDAFLAGGLLRVQERLFDVTDKGARWFAEQGIDIDALRSGRRPLARRCADWTELRPHVGGALGAALLRRLLERRWLRQSRTSRVISLTPEGDRALRAVLRHLATVTGAPAGG